MEKLDASLLDELVAIAKSLPAPRLKGRLRVIKAHGAVAVFDEKNTLALVMREEDWDSLGIESRKRAV